MNHPNELRMKQISLDDRYEATEGLVYLTGTQALVRLPMMQRQRDQAAGLNTAGYISGYRGSPVGGYDQALYKAAKQLKAHHIKFQPGLNEDLAATALWGTQQLHIHGDGKYDGVFGIWYGKGPGVDRSGDVLRHANQAGTSPHGGVLAIAGDDHGAKSSTVAAQVDHIFIAVSMPVLAPATVQDYIDFGLHGFAMSRFASVWVAIKAVTDTIEAAGIVDVSPNRIMPVLPTGIEWPAGGIHGRWPEEPFPKLEERLVRYKVPAVLAYARANRLDRNVFGVADLERGGAPARLALVSSGKAWLDSMQALQDLGIDQASAERIGLKVYKVAMPWPLEPSGAAAFVEGAEEVMVIEEKRSLIESQLKEQCYRKAQAPLVVGKRDGDGQALVPEAGELSPALCAQLIAQRLLPRLDPSDPHQAAVIASVNRYLKALQTREQGSGKSFQTIERIPYFCSGCPHNSSTKVPDGSRAHAGIGCHYMAMWMDRSTSTFSQMGGEGMTWVGQAPFSTTEHVFQNLGDGTFFHSGSLAIRHALASRTRITFKILFNDAVAMTGGQRHDGLLSPQMIAQLVRAEGVKRIEVVSDEPEKYPAGYFPSDVSVHHRRELDAVQRGLREFDGVSVLIYDQTCAAEKRRRRKRGAFPDPQRRAFINDAVCEGCGDCGVQANCVSIEPLETDMGRKRRINQSSCNKDFSCVEGFCPSFVTVEGGKPRRGKASKVAEDALRLQLPEVKLPVLDKPYALLVTGIGGTGVVTIGALLGMAAHLEGKAVTVLDMAGLAQKNGAVMSFVRFATQVDALHAPRIGLAAADAVLGCDVVVTSGKDALSKLRAGTRVIANVAATPTADFTRNTDWKFPLGSMESAIVDVVGEGQADFVDASRLATALLGDSIAANLFLLGYAWQKGMIPVSAEAIERAIELNETAVEQNKQAFLWGRRAAVDLYAVTSLALNARSGSHVAGQAKAMASSLSHSESLTSVSSFAALMNHRKAHLLAYQNEALVARFEALVQRSVDVEAKLRVLAKLSPASPLDALDSIDTRPLAAAVARYFSKLLAYKDEYEVARLHADPLFAAKLNEQFEGDFQLRFHLAPPLFAKRDQQGRLLKAEYGPWMMKAFGLLQHLKCLRGTAFDVFGRSDERRKERAWIERYEASLQSAFQKLEASLDDLVSRSRLTEAYQALVVLAQVPEHIRGFGHVKERHFEDAQRRWQQASDRFAKAFEAEPSSSQHSEIGALHRQAKAQVVEIRRTKTSERA